MPTLSPAARGLVLLGLLGGVAMVIAGQHSFAGQQLPSRGLAFFLGGIFLFAVCWLLAGQLERRSISDAPDDGEAPSASDAPFARPRAWRLGGLALLFALLAFYINDDNRITGPGAFFWISGWALFVGAFWETSGRPVTLSLPSWLRERSWPRIDIRRMWPILALLAIVMIAAFFRLYRLDDLPREMISDHAEKALDIQSVLDGDYHIYFPRNTGREPFQMYVTAGLVKLGGMDFNFLAIKLATALPAILVIPATYFMALNLFNNRKLALLAALLTALAFWPIATGRVGLRFAYAPLFVALTLGYLLRALKHGRRNDFLLCGLALGFGLYGYMAFRAMPLAVGLCLGLKFIADLVAAQGRPNLRYLGNASLLVLTSLLVYAPLGRYAIEFRDNYWFRIQTRGAESEVPVENAMSTFFGNVKDALLMFNWQGDVVWVYNIPFRPALDFVMGALLVLGVVILLLRWLRYRELVIVYMAIVFFVMMMPTALALAFPVENPAFGRGAGMIPVVFVLVAVPVYFTGAAIRRLLPERWGAVPVLGLTAGLLIWVTVLNSQLYFGDFEERYLATANNVTEVAGAMRDFGEAGPGIESTYIKIWPHWLDTRNLALTLGDFQWNNVLGDIEQAADQRGTPNPKLYILHPDDVDSLDWLRLAYPDGRTEEYQSSVGRNFIMFFTSPDASSASLPASESARR
ncbi:MAG: glycosyltransferase family 39 protein [Chloroflexi bacterium]|nr:glycosyltransferase family 39 protein [Chloroflexota bacterium]